MNVMRPQALRAHGRRSRDDAQNATMRSPAFWLVLAASTFNVFLCFVQTRGWSPVGNGVIAACEGMILAAGLFVIRHALSRAAVKAAVIVTLYVVAAKLFNGQVTIKIIHDLAVIYIFYELGRQAPPGVALAVLRVTIGLVVLFGFFELLFTDLYGRLLDVWSYYVSKGVIAQGTTNYSGTNLFLSGNRGGASSRTFFPSLLGSHRVSSIFLEPDSLGNFAAVAFAFAVSTWTRSKVSAGLIAAASLLCVVLADSRFAAGCCFFMLLVRLSPLARSRLLALALPLFVLAGLTLVGGMRELPGRLPAIMDDDFGGRLLFSGRLLGSWSLPEWLAFAPSPVYTADTGYAYLANNLGLPLSIGLLVAFAFHRCRGASAATFRTMISIYAGTALCVGASIFTIKTAALLWFLYGSLDGRAAEAPLRTTISPPRRLRPDGVTAIAARRSGVAVGLVVTIIATAIVFSQDARAQALRGVNLAGAAYSSNKIPGTYGRDFVYPNGKEIAYFASHRMNVFRISVLWERLQPSLNGPLDPHELARLREFVREVEVARATTIIDVHDYGRFRGAPIGSDAVTVADFRDLWARLSHEFGNDDHVLFGLMNEPQIASSAAWRDDLQAAIDGIRGAGGSNTILVSGIAWDAADRFVAVNAGALASLHDPDHRIVFEVHEYFDANGSGTTPDCVSPAVAVARLASFTKWLRTTHHRGFLGEFGVSRQPECLPVLAAVVADLRDNADVWLGWTYWAAGPLWGNYMFSIEPPKGGGDRPQMQTMEPFLQAHTPA